MIYKGTQKKMIMLKNTGSRFFEEAYFIIRDEAADPCGTAACENDMIKEANRIISETFRESTFSDTVSSSYRRKRSPVFWFFAGSLCGSAVTLLISQFIFG